MGKIETLSQGKLAIHSVLILNEKKNANNMRLRNEPLPLHMLRNSENVPRVESSMKHAIV